MLITDTPATVATLNHVNEPLFVAHVGVVVGRQQIAILREEQRLGIPESVGETFKAGAVWVHAVHRARLQIFENRALFRFHVRPAITEGEIDFAVGTPGEAVEIVTGDTEANSIAAANFGPGFGATVAGKFPDARDIPEP